MSCLTISTNPAGPDSQASLRQVFHTSLITSPSRSSVFHAKPDWPDTDYQGSQWGVLLYIESKSIIHTGMCVLRLISWRWSLKERKSSKDYMVHMYLFLFFSKFPFLKAIHLIYQNSRETWNESKTCMFWFSWNFSVYRINIFFINNQYPTLFRFDCWGIYVMYHFLHSIW